MACLEDFALGAVKGLVPRGEQVGRLVKKWSLGGFDQGSGWPR